MSLKIQLNKWYLVKRSVRFFSQRLFRGFDDSETWNLDTRFAEHVLPRLKRFKQLKNGYPHNLTSEQWDIILDQMIFSFEWAASDYVERAEDMETYQRVQEGLDLFGKWYQNLWW